MVQRSALTAAERHPHSAFPAGAHAVKTDRSAPWIPAEPLCGCWLPHTCHQGPGMYHCKPGLPGLAGPFCRGPSLRTSCPMPMAGRILLSGSLASGLRLEPSPVFTKEPVCEASDDAAVAPAPRAISSSLGSNLCPSPSRVLSANTRRHQVCRES